jgi:ketosteroid isomerase-like protein
VEHSVDEILQVEAQLQQAMLQGDAQALNRLLHTDLVSTSQSGIVAGKQEDLQNYASGTLNLTTCEFIDPLVQLYGETAIVFVKVHLRGKAQKTPFAGKFQYTRVWLFQEGAWQVVASHCSEMG